MKSNQDRRTSEISVSLTGEERDRVTTACERLGVSRTDVFRDLINDWTNNVYRTLQLDEAPERTQPTV